MDKFKNILSENKFILLLAAFVTAKFFIFYSMMGVNSYFSMVVLISVGLTGIFFSIFGRKKGLAAFLYLLLSGLMFADVTYYSYFGKYLSVAMAGAAGMVGTITECIEEVMRPANFLMFADALIIIIFMIASRCVRRYRINRGYILPRPEEIRKEAAIVEALGSFFAWCRRVDAFCTMVFDAVTTLPPENPAPKPPVSEEEAAARRTRRDGRRQVIARIIAFALVVDIIITTAGFSDFSLSIRNQEFFTYHLHDLFSSFADSDDGDLTAFEDSYRMEKDGPLFGVAKGRNIVYIQIESFMDFVIGREYNGQELTPNLNALISREDTVYFDHFYQQVGSGNTSDAEFAANNSIYGTVLSYTYEVYGSKNYFRGMPVLLGDMGYETAVFHGFQDKTYWSREAAYPNLGFDRYFGGLVHEGGGDYVLTDWMGWGIPDSDFFDQTATLMKDNLKAPYYAFVNTLSNHNPFKMLDKYRFIEVENDLKDTTVGNYLQSIAYTDYSIGVFLERLKEEGLYDNTIFVMYGDHAGLTHSADIDEGMCKILGTDHYPDSELLNVPCIIHIPGADLGEERTISKACGQLDLLPTLAYLMGWEDLDTIYFGHNMFAPGEGFVAEQTFVKKGSFIKGNIMYEIALDGIFDHGSAWNVDTLEPVSIEGLYEDYERCMALIGSCEYLLKTDALREKYLGITTEQQHADYPDAVAVAGYPDSSLVGKGSIEALDESYNAGQRQILLTVEWQSDEKGNPTGIYTIDEDTGMPVLDEYQILEWFGDHEDTQLAFRLTGERINSLDNVRLLFGNMGEEGKKLGRKILFYAAETDDVTGRYDVFLDVSTCNGNASDIETFIKTNDIWALIIHEEDLDGPLAKLRALGIRTYIMHPSGIMD